MGITDPDINLKKNLEKENLLMNKHIGSILRLFLAIMVFVVFVLTISK